jgi:hypothetical protein
LAHFKKKNARPYLVAFSLEYKETLVLLCPRILLTIQIQLLDSEYPKHRKSTPPRVIYAVASYRVQIVMRLPRTGYRLLSGCLVQGTDCYAVVSYRVQIVMRLPRTGYRFLCGCLVQGTDCYAVALYRVQIVMRLPRTGYRLLCGCLEQGTDSYVVASYRVQIIMLLPRTGYR